MAEIKSKKKGKKVVEVVEETPQEECAKHIAEAQTEDDNPLVKSLQEKLVRYEQMFQKHQAEIIKLQSERHALLEEVKILREQTEEETTQDDGRAEVCSFDENDKE